MLRPTSATWSTGTARSKRTRLLEIERVAREHLLRSHRARQNLLVPGELDDGLQRLAVLGDAVRKRVVADHAAALRDGLRVRGQSCSRLELLQKHRLGVLEGAEQARRQGRI